MNILQWLDGGALPRLAELIAINSGSMVISGEIGRPVATTDNRYGRVGLTVEEAFELTYMRGIFDALSNANVMMVVKEKIEREMSGRKIILGNRSMLK